MRKVTSIRSVNNRLFHTLHALSGLVLQAVLLISFIPTVSSCRSQEDKAPEEIVDEGIDPEIDSTVTAIYSLFINEKYDEYVNQVESNDSKPAEYRKQMAVLYKTRHLQQKEENGGPVKCRLVHFEPNGDSYGSAFVEVTYKDKTKENILLQMVKVKGRWRIR